MIQETYNISHEAMESLRKHLRHPSYENAVLRESIMQQLHSEMPSTIEGNSETVQFENLDLGFLLLDHEKSEFRYSEVSIENEQPMSNVSMYDTKHPAACYWDEYIPTTAA